MIAIALIVPLLPTRRATINTTPEPGIDDHVMAMTTPAALLVGQRRPAARPHALPENCRCHR
jgi:hypothetical protein